MNLIASSRTVTVADLIACGVILSVTSFLLYFVKNCKYRSVERIKNDWNNNNNDNDNDNNNNNNNNNDNNNDNNNNHHHHHNIFCNI